MRETFTVISLTMISISVERGLIDTFRAWGLATAATLITCYICFELTFVCFFWLALTTGAGWLVETWNANVPVDRLVALALRFRAIVATCRVAC